MYDLKERYYFQFVFSLVITVIVLAIALATTWNPTFFLVAFWIFGAIVPAIFHLIIYRGFND